MSLENGRVPSRIVTMHEDVKLLVDPLILYHTVTRVSLPLGLRSSPCQTLLQEFHGLHLPVLEFNSLAKTKCTARARKFYKNTIACIRCRSESRLLLAYLTYLPNQSPSGSFGKELICIQREAFEKLAMDG